MKLNSPGANEKIDLFKDHVINIPEYRIPDNGKKFTIYRYLRLMNKKSTPGGNNGVSGVSKELLIQ